MADENLDKPEQEIEQALPIEPEKEPEIEIGNDFIHFKHSMLEKFLKVVDRGFTNDDSEIIKQYGEEVNVEKSKFSQLKISAKKIIFLGKNRTAFGQKSTISEKRFILARRTA